MDTFGSATNTSITVTTSSTLVLALNPNRAYVAICNDSDATVYLAFAASASLNSGIRLASGQAFEIVNALNPYIGPIYAITSTGSKVLTLTHATFV